MPAPAELLERVLDLSLEDRRDLFHRLGQSIEADSTSPEIEQAWALEIAARLDAYDRGDVELIDADVVFESARRHLAEKRAKAS